MKKQLRRRAFTMVELLTVIAIIAILAAILFPIFGTIREQARQSSTMSNMHDMYVAARSYFEDEGRFPSVLFGYAEVADPNITPPFRPANAQADQPSAVLPMDQITGVYQTGQGLNRGSLFREQVKNLQAYFAADEIVRNRREITNVYWPINSPLGAGSSIDSNGVLQQGRQVTWMATNSSNQCTVYGDSDLPVIPGVPSYIGTPKYFYKMDAMDIGPMLTRDGKQVRDGTGAIAYELHYTPDWTHLLGAQCDTDRNGNPHTAQLKYKNPPRERTILTYNTHHAAFGGSPYVLVLRTDGVARKMNVRDAFDQMPLNYR